MRRAPAIDAGRCHVRDPHCTGEGTATCDFCKRRVCGACAVLTPERRLVCHDCAVAAGQIRVVSLHLATLTRNAEIRAARAARRVARALRRAWEEATPVEPPHISTRRTAKAPRVTMLRKEPA